MDLGLYLRVLWRFRRLVAAGVAVSAGLALLTHVRVDVDGGVPNLSYRTPLVWASTSTVLITEKGFPWGASSLQDVEALQRGARPEGPQYSDPNRFTQLAFLYAGLAKSDEVRAMVDRKSRLEGASYSVSPVIRDGISLPLLSIRALSNSRNDARALAQAATEAFRAYIAREQQANAIPPGRRVKLDVVRSARPAQVVSSRSLVKPMFVLIIGLAATFGLAFALENFRPRETEVEASAPASPFPVARSKRKTA
jgi:hypothetical protein